MITDNGDSTDSDSFVGLNNTILKVEYSIVNLKYENGKDYPPFPAKTEADNGSPIIFRIQNNPNYPKAMPVIVKAIKDVACYTCVNFLWDTVQRKDINYGNMDDGIPTISFGYDDILISNPNFLAYEITQAQDLCTRNVDNSQWSYFYDADIVIDYHRTFSYDTTGANLAPNEYSFYEVVLHELGHAAGLSHIVSDYLLMKPNSLKGSSSANRYNLYKHADETLIQGVDWMFTASNRIDFTGSTCTNYYRMLKTACFDEVLVDDQTFFESIQLYNNPTADGTVSLRFKLLKPELVSFKVVDLMGRALQEQQKDYTSTEVDEALDLGKQPTGVYGLIVQKGKDVQMFKIVKQ